MSFYDYQKSKEISSEAPSFRSLIMAAAWDTDTLNYGKLKAAFPEIIEELEKIYFRGDKLRRPQANSEVSEGLPEVFFSPSLTI